MKKIIIVSLLLLASGCYAKLTPMMRTPENIDSYRIGVIQTTSVGEPMLSRIKASYSPGYIADKDFLPPHIVTRQDLIPKGSKWYILGKFSDGTVVCGNPDYPKPFENTSTASWDYCLAVDKNGFAFGYAPCILSSNADEERRENEGLKVHSWNVTQNTKFLTKIDKVYHRGSLHQEIIYSSKSGNILELTYREFIDDPTNITYSNKLTYHLERSGSTTIGFREMLIEIMEATDSQIKFLVKSQMN
jgi:hypothetical protein